MRAWRRLLGWALLAALPGGCHEAGSDQSTSASAGDRDAAKASEVVAVRGLHAGAHCGDSSGSAGRIRLIREAAAFEELRDALRASSDGDEGAAPDLEETVAIRVDMGQRPSGGYGVILASNEARVSEGELYLPVRWQVPAPDALTTAVITQPCLIVMVPDRDYEAVSVVDRTGEVRLRRAFP